ncbi:MAG TPA: DUF3108 domain-containing protein [Terriglobia bacterium]|nr:DUF3108 domain-containing protein [Terriglobia bacterium]
MRRAAIAFTLVLLSGVLFAQIPTPQAVLPFNPGETLNYAITWSLFPAGEVTSTIGEIGSGQDDAYQINVTARSSGVVSLLYNIDNAYHATADPRTLCSRQIEKTINEGGRHKQTHILFDSGKREAILDERDMGKAGHPLKHSENAIPACVEDIVTAFYYLRRQPMQVGDKISVPVNDGSKTHTVVVDVQAREQIKTPLGPRYAFRLEPRALGDLYKKKGRMLIWISDDHERLPLRIKAMMLIGTITGNLQSVTYKHTSSTP